MIDKLAYRNAMAHLAAAVNVVTSAGPHGLCGLTATAVCSVTDEPPTIALCVNRSSVNNEHFKKNGIVCINTLSSCQQDVSEVFSGLTKCSMEDRFQTGEWEILENGIPSLKSALASFNCRITDVLEKGSHSIFFAEVIDIESQTTETNGLIYFRRAYFSIGA